MKATRLVTVLLAVIGVAAAVFLKTNSWTVSEIIPGIETVNEVLVVDRLNVYPDTRQEYMDDGQSAAFLSVVGDMELQFEKKSNTFAYENDLPAYDLFLSGAEGTLGAIFVSGNQFHYDNTLYTMTETDAAALNKVLASCFS